MKKILFVISKTGFQSHEFNIPKNYLESAGFQVVVASLESGLCQGGDGLSTAIAEKSISDCNSSDYEGVVFIGGPGAYGDFLGNEDYYSLAKKAKKVGAICIAPTILSYSGVLNGIKVAARNQSGQKEEIEKNDGIFVEGATCLDGKFLTAKGPTAAEEFGIKLVEFFS